MRGMRTGQSLSVRISPALTTSPVIHTYDLRRTCIPKAIVLAAQLTLAAKTRNSERVLQTRVGTPADVEPSLEIEPILPVENRLILDLVS